MTRPRSRLAHALTVLALSLLAAVPSVATARTKHHRHGRAAATRPCPGARTPAGAAGAAAMRAAVLCLTNRERTSRGLPSLRESWRLDRSAQGWTSTMVSVGQFSHGSNFAARISSAGFAWSSAGENIATGFLTAQQVLAAWMASPGHCRNILDPDYSYLGIGFSPRAVAGFGGQGATWTQDFALPRGQQAPSRNWQPADRCPY